MKSKVILVWTVCLMMLTTSVVSFAAQSDVYNVDGTPFASAKQMNVSSKLQKQVNATASKFLYEGASSNLYTMNDTFSAWSAANGNPTTFVSNLAEKNQVIIKTALMSGISAANINKTTATVSTDGRNVLPENKWVTQTVMTAYETAIATAQTVANRAVVTQTEVNNEVVALTAATGTFNGAKADGIATYNVTMLATGDTTVVKQISGTSIYVVNGIFTEELFNALVAPINGSFEIRNPDGSLAALDFDMTLVEDTMTVVATAGDGTIVAYTIVVGPELVTINYNQPTGCEVEIFSYSAGSLISNGDVVVSDYLNISASAISTLRFSRITITEDFGDYHQMFEISACDFANWGGQFTWSPYGVVTIEIALEEVPTTEMLPLIVGQELSTTKLGTIIDSSTYETSISHGDIVYRATIFENEASDVYSVRWYLTETPNDPTSYEDIGWTSGDQLDLARIQERVGYSLAKRMGWSLAEKYIVVETFGIEKYSIGTSKVFFKINTDMYTPLINAISDAKTNNEGLTRESVDGSDVFSHHKWVTVEVKRQYVDAIAEACDVVNTHAATQIELDNAVSELADATSLFNDSKQYGTIYQNKITATVKDFDTDEPISNASIGIQWSYYGDYHPVTLFDEWWFEPYTPVTDENGESVFYLWPIENLDSEISDDFILVVSADGYKDSEWINIITESEDISLNFFLKKDIQSLDSNI